MALEFTVGVATPDQAAQAQHLDDATWDGGFQHYEELSRDVYPEGVRVATDFEGSVLGYIGAERLLSKDLCVGMLSNFERSLPPWNHDPKDWHKPEGNVLYILGHAVKPNLWRAGVSEKILDEFESFARTENGIEQLAVIYNLRHPTLRNPLSFWGRHGFKPIPHTYDPNWKVTREEAPVGSIVFAKTLGN